jgi:hypothetical protein
LLQIFDEVVNFGEFIHTDWFGFEIVIKQSCFIVKLPSCFEG